MGRRGLDEYGFTNYGRCKAGQESNRIVEIRGKIQMWVSAADALG